jgi:hypothetical protein
MESNDHDALIRIETSMNILISNQTQFFAAQKELSERVVALEIKDRGDSERVGNIFEAVKATANNSTRITEAHENIKALAEDVKDLKSKSNFFDVVNGALAGLAALLGMFYGK